MGEWIGWMSSSEVGTKKRRIALLKLWVDMYFSKKETFSGNKPVAVVNEQRS